MNDRLPAHTAAAIDALIVALITEDDLPGWLANVLATVAARLDPGVLTARRPGSWESQHVAALAEGGWPLGDTGPRHGSGQ